MKKTTKNLKKGFTLVEVIVVAVIVAILAAVAIPIYQGYVEDSNRDQASNTAGSIASYCGACAAKGGACPTGDIAENVNVTCTGAGVTAGAATAVLMVPAGSTATLTASSVEVCRGTATTPICSEEYFWAAATP